MNSICSGRSNTLSGKYRFIRMRIPPNATPATIASPAKNRAQDDNVQNQHVQVVHLRIFASEYSR